MVLENVKEMWTEKPKGGKGRGVNKDRFISKMFVSPASIRKGFLNMGLLMEIQVFARRFGDSRLA